jgi:hypothetical protein
MAQPNLEGLSLHEDEDEEGFCFDFDDEEDEQADLRWCLIGRFLCDRAIHFNSMKVRMADLWKPIKGVTIKAALAGRFLFHFNHPLDMEAVLNGGPWTFDNNMLILERAHLGMQIEHIPLHHVNMWVQVHDLPMGFMREIVGVKLANYIGVFVEYDKNNNSSFWRQHMRIRVQIDVRKPLKINHKVKDKAGAWCTVKFKYEKLGVFCFVCGIMGHTENKCEILFAKEHDDCIREWSSEIRADLRRQGGRVTSKWLREEGGGITEQGGSRSSGQSNFPTCNSHADPTAAELASVNHSIFHNRTAGNHGAVITNQQQSSALITLSPQSINLHRPDPTKINTATCDIAQNTRIPPNNHSVFTLTETNGQTFSPLSFKGADNINFPCPTTLPILTSHNSMPLILTRPETDTNKTQLLPNQTLTFNSQPINSHQKSTDQIIFNPNPIPGPSLTRPKPDKKTRNTKIKPNPTQTRLAHPTSHGNSDDMETQSEKKRRRELHNYCQLE